jgi:membrane-associated protease RseP (regulator of RpoE activity)
MFRDTVFAALVGVSLMTWGAEESLAQQRPQAGLERSGWLVTQVQPDSPAAQKGLKEGDIIVRVNGNTVRPTADLNRWLRSVANVADLEVVDGTTGRLNRVTVYPRGGRIGVTGEAVAVANIAPVKAETQPTQQLQPRQPWAPELYPLVYPWSPGLYPPPVYPCYPCYPGLYPLPGNPWNHGMRP